MTQLTCTLSYQASWNGGPQAGGRHRVTGESLEIGRGTGCPIHLPDPRVKLRQATLHLDETHCVRIEAEPEALLDVNGRLERVAKLNLGDRVSIGPFLLTVIAPEDGVDLALEIDRFDAPSVSFPIESEHRSLAALGISKRRWGLLLAMAILGSGLALLLLTKMSPSFEHWQSRLPVSLSSLLSPGPLTSGHSLLNNRCSACHQDAFHAVTDTSCGECHRFLPGHRRSSSPPNTDLPEVGCIRCHALHEARAENGRTSAPECVACHAKVRRRVADVTDFSIDHPDFRLTVTNGELRSRYYPNDLEMPADNNGLRFSHRIHLAKEGVSSPDGNTVLTCTDCHRPDKSGEHFDRIKMETTCQQSRCHRIRQDAPATGFAPHGSEQTVMDRLRVALMNDPDEQLRSCPPTAGVSTAKALAACTERRALEIAGTGLFREEGGKLKCALCHVIARRDDPASPWSVNPVRIPQDWFPGARFPHRRHQTIPCTECHDKKASNLSEDISLPDIRNCQRCHAGSRSTSNRVASPCESCHRYHRYDKDLRLTFVKEKPAATNYK